MEVFTIEILEAKECIRCKMKVPENTTVLGIWSESSKGIICQDCIQILWKSVEVRNKLKEGKK